MLRPWPCVLLGIGCSSSDGGKGSSFADTGFPGGMDTGPAMVDTGGSASPTWWKLSADLDVENGEVVAATSSLELVRVDETGQPTTPDCRATAVPQSVEPTSDLPDSVLVSWWTVDGGEWSEDCEQAAPDLPVAPFGLGVGAMHPDIRAVIDTLDDPRPAEGAEDTLNAAYIQLVSEGPIYVFGVAGLPAAYAAQAGPASEAPLDDGTWWVRPLYALPAWPERDTGLP